MATHNLFDTKYVHIAGLPFLDEHHLKRFPSSMEDKIYQENKALKYLGYHLSGGAIFFKTNAKLLTFFIDYGNEPLMNHMPPSGESGFDVYIMHQGMWIFYESIRPFPREKELHTTLRLPKEDEHQLMIYTPLYAKVIKASVSISDDEVMYPLFPRFEKTIFIYGTSITQGACASRPGMSYTNQLSRMLSVEIINMGFSGNGLGEPSMAELTHMISSLDMVIIDYDANAGAIGVIEKTLIPWISTVRVVHKDIPILIISRIPFNKEYFENEDHEKRIKNKMYQSDVAKTLPNVYFVDGETLIYKEETDVTVDGIHLNDVGMTLFAKRLEPIINQLLKR